MQTAINQIHCQNYILKPYTTEELLEAIHFLLKTPYLKPTPLKLCDTNGVYYKVSEEDLLYIEAAGKELRFHLLVSEHNRISQLCTNKYRLTELRQILSNHFLQCHKKYIVNLDHITAYDKASSSILLDAFPLPVGRKYKQELEQKILSG